MMKYRVFVLLLCVSAATTPALATDRQTRDIFESFTACVVKNSPKRAAEVVLSMIPSDEIIKKYPDLITPDCLDAAQLTLPGGDFLRYGLAEQLVRKEYVHGLPSDFAQAGPIARGEINDADYQPKPGKPATPKELAALEEHKKRDLAVLALSNYGECVVRADPAGALSLVLSNPSSDHEANAFTRLQPALSSCLTRGATIKLDKADIRGSIALNLYRLAKATRVPASTTAK